MWDVELVTVLAAADARPDDESESDGRRATGADVSPATPRHVRPSCGDIDVWQRRFPDCGACVRRVRSPRFGMTAARRGHLYEGYLLLLLSIHHRTSRRRYDIQHTQGAHRVQ
jgi:hypothetical protein